MFLVQTNFNTNGITLDILSFIDNQHVQQVNSMTRQNHKLTEMQKILSHKVQEQENLKLNCFGKQF